MREILNMSELGSIKSVIEPGSSDRAFREKSQPHILRNIHDPLQEKGVRVVTTDLKRGEDIDVSGDIFDPATQAKLKSMRPDVILCCNILEHVSDPRTFAAACNEILPNGKFIIVTVPFSYPYHLDPIDTMLRPNPAQIAELFPNYRLVRGEIIKTGNYLSDMRRHKDSVQRSLLRTIVRSVWPRLGIEQCKARWHRWLWFRKSFENSVVLLQKEGAA